MNAATCQSAIDLELARALLIASKGATCVAVCGDDVMSSRDHGVASLMSWLVTGRRLYGYSVADRVVGKAAALLYAALGPEAVFAQTMTKSARAVLVSNGIRVSYDQLVDSVREQGGAGRPCALDASLFDVFDPYEAVPLIARRLSTIVPA